MRRAVGVLKAIHASMGEMGLEWFQAVSQSEEEAKALHSSSTSNQVVGA